jgi:hypothetical protein
MHDLLEKIDFVARPSTPKISPNLKSETFKHSYINPTFNLETKRSVIEQIYRALKHES